jgi:PAS domain S-box-containing protein
MKRFSPFSWYGQLRLRWKLAIFIVAVLASTAMFFYVYIPGQIGDFASRAVKDKARVVAAMTAANVSAAMVFEDTVQIRAELLTAQLSRDVIYAVVVDQGGQVRGVLHLEEARNARYGETPLDGDLFNHSIFRLCTPIEHGERPLGMLYLGFSNARVIESESVARTRTLVITLIVLLFSVIVVIGLTSVMTARLRTMVDTARRVTAGDLQQRVHVHARDDVGEMGDAMNVMLDRLASSQRELADANHDLEVRVERRTKALADKVEEHRSTVESLRISQQRLRQVIDLVPHFIFAKDATGQFTLVNAAVARAYGTTVEELLGKKDADFAATPEEAEHFRQDDMEVIRSKTEKRIAEEAITTADGKRLILQTMKIPFTFSESDVPAVLGVSMDITALKEFQDQLQSSLREKEVMLKEIHHRVKNNLQIISSLLNLQSSSIADPALKELMLESQNRIRSMALVHEHLYKSGSLATIDFADYLNYGVAQLARSYGKPGVRCIVDAEPGTLTIEEAIPCGLIVNELISNSFKHAFGEQEEGLIEIRFQTVVGSVFEVVVRDNGIGFPDGVDFTSVASMGMTLINNLVEQLEGTITIERNHGTLFRLQFPMSS